MTAQEQQLDYEIVELGRREHALHNELAKVRRLRAEKLRELNGLVNIRPCPGCSE